MKNLITLSFILLLLSSCERGSISRSGRQVTTTKELTTKVVILEPKNFTYSNGKTARVYKVKVLSNSTVGHIASSFEYSKGDTIIANKQGIQY